MLFAVAVLALLERRADPAFACDRALLGPAFGLLLPLGCFSLARSLFRSGVEPALAPFASLGVDRRTVLVGRALVLLLAGLALAVLLGLSVLAVAGPTASWPRELWAIVWVAGLAGMAYGALLLLGVALGRHGLWLLLLGDWLLGSGSGWFALPWPRAHVRSLLGGESVLWLSQPTSAVLLLGLVALWLVVSVVRTPP